MNHATGPQAADIRTEYHAEFVMGEHSARHPRRILRRGQSVLVEGEP